MDWVTASQLAAEVTDIVGMEKVTARQQEEIASLIYNRYGWTFNDHWQKWERKPSEIERLEAELAASRKWSKAWKQALRHRWKLWRHLDRLCVKYLTPAQRWGAVVNAPTWDKIQEA